MRYNGSMVNFIDAKRSNRQRIVLFQTGIYKYEIWSQTRKETLKVLYDTSWENAVQIFKSFKAV